MPSAPRLNTGKIFRLTAGPLIASDVSVSIGETRLGFAVNVPAAGLGLRGTHRIPTLAEARAEARRVERILELEHGAVVRHVW